MSYEMNIIYCSLFISVILKFSLSYYEIPLACLILGILNKHKIALIKWLNYTSLNQWFNHIKILFSLYKIETL